MRERERGRCPPVLATEKSIVDAAHVAPRIVKISGHISVPDRVQLSACVLIGVVRACPNVAKLPPTNVLSTSAPSRQAIQSNKTSSSRQVHAFTSRSAMTDCGKGIFEYFFTIYVLLYCNLYHPSVVKFRLRLLYSRAYCHFFAAFIFLLFIICSAIQEQAFGAFRPTYALWRLLLPRFNFVAGVGNSKNPRITQSLNHDRISELTDSDSAVGEIVSSP